jgi:hypothetical protein
MLGITIEVISELGTHFGFFSDRKAPIHGHQDREHEQGQQRRPLQQEAQQD